eukprot:jgi/Phyca11/19401/fgenesh1_pg.PHYCAscaffold_48_\
MMGCSVKADKKDVEFSSPAFSRDQHDDAPASSSPDATIHERPAKNTGKEKRAKGTSPGAATPAKPSRKKPAGKAAKAQKPTKKKKMTNKQLLEEEEKQRREMTSRVIKSLFPAQC